MPPHERYAMMTMEFEANSFPTKALVMDRVRELNDFEADTLLAFDRNDEQNHVRYGHRWLPEMMALFGEKRPVEDFVKATQAKFYQLAEVHGGKTPHSLLAEGPPDRRENRQARRGQLRDELVGRVSLTRRIEILPAVARRRRNLQADTITP